MSSIPGSVHPGRRIALGFTRHLDDFAHRQSAETWKQFAKDHPMQWESAFIEVMNDPDTVIFFNLENVGVWRGVNRAAVGQVGPTDWELLQIMQNGTWRTRIQWFDVDDPRSNPSQ